MHKRYLPWIAVALVSLCWLIPVQAQDAENESVAELIMITPKSGEGPALEAAIKDYHYWIANKPGAFRYTWFQIETGPDTGKYVARTGEHNWADFDAEFDWQDEAGEKFMSDVAPHVEHAERWFVQGLPEFSNLPEDFAGYTLFQVERWYIKSGQYGKWRAGLERIHQALTEGGFKEYYGFTSTVSGGKANEVSLVLPMKGYADFAEPDPSFFDIVSAALGGPEAFADFMVDFGSTFQSGDTFLVRVLPEASDYGDEE